jgi:hypothetical protein
VAALPPSKGLSVHCLKMGKQSVCGGDYRGSYYVEIKTRAVGKAGQKLAVPPKRVRASFGQGVSRARGEGSGPSLVLRGHMGVWGVG